MCMLRAKGSVSCALHAAYHHVNGMAVTAAPCRLLKSSQEDAGKGFTAQHCSDLPRAMSAYLGDPTPEASFQAGSDMRLIRCSGILQARWTQARLSDERSLMR